LSGIFPDSGGTDPHLSGLSSSGRDSCADLPHGNANCLGKNGQRFMHRRHPSARFQIFFNLVSNFLMRRTVITKKSAACGRPPFVLVPTSRRWRLRRFVDGIAALGGKRDHPSKRRARAVALPAAGGWHAYSASNILAAPGGSMDRRNESDTAQFPRPSTRL